MPFLYHFKPVTVISNTSHTVAILSYIDPASAIVLSSIVFMQMPKVYEIIGVVLIMGAAILSETEKDGA